MKKKDTPLFPVIDQKATGRRLRLLRLEKQYTVEELASFLGFPSPRAVYLWQNGSALPSLDHMYALALIFNTPMEEIIQQAHLHLHLSALPDGVQDGDTVVLFHLIPKGNKFALVQIQLPVMIHLARPP